jgi:fucose permease
VIILGYLGATALYLTYLWLASCIAASWLAKRKGYAEKWGLAAGLLLNAIGVIVWLFVPARERSPWKDEGMLPRRRGPGRD